MCAFTEAGVLRFLTRPETGEMSMEPVTLMLDNPDARGNEGAQR